MEQELLPLPSLVPIIPSLPTELVTSPATPPSTPYIVAASSHPDVTSTTAPPLSPPSLPGVSSELVISVSLVPPQSSTFKCRARCGKYTLSWYKPCRGIKKGAICLGGPWMRPSL